MNNLGITISKQHAVRLLSTCLCLVGLSLAASGFCSMPPTSDSKPPGILSTVNTSQAGPILIAPGPATGHMNTRFSDSAPSQHQTIKHTLNESPRDLSVFFAIGVAINFIMAAVFAWWFSREWRRSAKRNAPDK